MRWHFFSNYYQAWMPIKDSAGIVPIGRVIDRLKNFGIYDMDSLTVLGTIVFNGVAESELIHYKMKDDD